MISFCQENLDIYIYFLFACFWCEPPNRLFQCLSLKTIQFFCNLNNYMCVKCKLLATTVDSPSTNLVPSTICQPHGLLHLSPMDWLNATSTRWWWWWWWCGWWCRFFTGNRFLIMNFCNQISFPWTMDSVWMWFDHSWSPLSIDLYMMILYKTKRNPINFKSFLSLFFLHLLWIR